jgi:hypothetical protein
MSLQINRTGQLIDGVSLIQGVQSTLREGLFIGLEGMNQKALATFLPKQLFFTTNKAQ